MATSPHSPAKAGSPASAWTERLTAHVPALSLIVLCIVFSLSSEVFLSTRNLLNVIDQLTVLGILALGMTAVIVIGGIDLSVGSVLAVSMMVMGWASNVQGVPMPLAIVAALVVGALCGTFSGLLITRSNLPPFIATLATMSIARAWPT